MTYIQKISMEGFKSFKRKVSIPLLPGFTVFTGPNGSGKSNCAEALSFVFGLQSRSLRAKKAEELIFHGSKTRTGSDHAKVYVHFNNSKKMIPIDDPEIVIGRKINKSGVSAYKINGKTVTKQQLVDMFAQIRITPGGHNIIHQGDVSQIVEMNPIQRRQVIDEISGIAEYEDKKQKAEKELTQVGEKLREAEIILNERMQILERIKKDRDAASEHKKLSEELEFIRATLIWKERQKGEEEISEINARSQVQQKELAALENEIKGLDSKLDDEEKAIENITSEVLKASTRIEATKKFTQLKSDIERKNDRTAMNLREIDRIRDVISRVKEGASPFIKELKQFKGVEGTVNSLITVPQKYSIASDVAGGGHLNDIVVDTSANVLKCVNYLKENRLGRARFLPLDRINSPAKKELPKGAIGWMSDLIKHDSRYVNIVNFVFGTTACIDNIENAKRVFDRQRARLVTLDGDLIEAAGSITGGFFKKRDDNRFFTDIEKLEKENEALEKEISQMQVEFSRLSKETEKTESISSEVKKIKFDERMKKIRESRKEFYEKRLNLMQKLNEINIERARVEARMENIKQQWERYKEFEGNKLESFLNQKLGHLKEREKTVIERLNSIGPVNLRATDEFDSLIKDFEVFKAKFDKIVEEKNIVESSVNEIEEKRKEVFTNALNKVSKGFKEIWVDLTKGEADLKLENTEDINSGLVISASPSGKKLLNLDAMSGGEKTLTAVAFLFSIQRYKPCPFYILDEADAALDKTNSQKLGELIKKQSKYTQFLLISHNDEIIKSADQVYGISMDDGESKVIAVKLPEN